MKLYYLFLLIMSLILGGCTENHSSYYNTHKAKRDTVRTSYSNNNHSTNKTSNNSYTKIKTYKKPKSSLYKKKSYSSSKRSHSSKSRSRRR